MNMEYVFFVGVVAAFLAAGSIGAYVALRNLKAEWGEEFTLRRKR